MYCNLNYTVQSFHPPWRSWCPDSLHYKYIYIYMIKIWIFSLTLNTSRVELVLTKGSNLDHIYIYDQDLNFQLNFKHKSGRTSSNKRIFIFLIQNNYIWSTFQPYTMPLRHRLVLTLFKVIIMWKLGTRSGRQAGSDFCACSVIDRCVVVVTCSQGRVVIG